MGKIITESPSKSGSPAYLIKPDIVMKIRSRILNLGRLVVVFTIQPPYKRFNFEGV